MSRRDLFPASHSLTLLAMIGGNAAAAIGLPVLCWITIPFAAIAMTGALSVVHEASHATYFSSRLANRIIGRVFALLILVNFSLYRRDHMLHHAHLGTERDTEEKKHINSVYDLTAALLFNDHAIVHWRRSLAAAFSVERSDALRRDAWLVIVVFLAAVSATIVWAPSMAAAFWAPLLLSLVMDNAVSLPEHATIGAETETMAVPTRTIVSSAGTEFLLYYVNRHLEHHQNPTISAVSHRRSGSDEALAISYVGFYRAALAPRDSA
jgi:fatty acid desaturase